MSLHSDIKKCDEKSIKDLEDLYNRSDISASTLPILIDLIQAPQHQVAASWLLKHYLEEGGALKPDQVLVLYESLLQLEKWQARLHILQIMQYMPMPQQVKMPLVHFLRLQLGDSNKFIRAWAYNGFFLLANSFPEYQKEVNECFELALKDEAPSVKARIKQIMRS